MIFYLICLFLLSSSSANTDLSDPETVDVENEAMWVRDILRKTWFLRAVSEPTPSFLVPTRAWFRIVVDFNIFNHRTHLIPHLALNSLSGNIFVWFIHWFISLRLTTTTGYSNDHSPNFAVGLNMILSTRTNYRFRGGGGKFTNTSFYQIWYGYG